jgi:RND superfamily putative drug exporter
MDAGLYGPGPTTPSTTEPVSGLGARVFARLVVGSRWLIVPGWIAVASLSAVFLPIPSSSEGEQVADLVPQDAPAIQAEIASVKEFAFPVLSRIAVVQRDANGLSAEAQVRVLTRAIDVLSDQGKQYPGLIAAVPLINTLSIVPASTEDSTTAITYLFFGPDVTLVEQDEAASRFAAQEIQEPGDALIGVTGAIPARVEQTRVILRYLPFVEVATVVLIALIMGLTFRSLVAPLVALGTSAVAYVLALHVAGWAAERFGISLPRDLEPVLVVLLLGVVTDYCIFFLAGYRARLGAGDDRLTGARVATARYAPLVFTAGLIVAAGTAALLVATLGLLRAFGPGLAITVLVALVVSVTFVPALMAILGRRTFWPARLGAPEETSPELEHSTRRGWRSAVARAMTGRLVAAPVALLIVGILVLAAIGLTRTRLGLTLIVGLPKGDSVRVAAEAAQRGFEDGILSPTVVLVQGEGLDAKADQLAALQEGLARQPGVAAVAGPATPIEQLPEGFAVAESGTAARFLIVLDADPLGARAIDELENLRDALPGLVEDAGLKGVRTSLAGDTALASEAVDQTVHDLGRVAVAALVVDLLLLALFLRSLVAPLYLLAASVLALAAALGLTTLVFQGLLGQEQLTYYVPFAAAVLLVALGSDYNVFVVGRIWGEARRRPIREAISLAVPEASRAIAVAGVTLAASFAILAVVPLVQFREFAFAMLAGVLLDSFLVRSLLVPALVALFGRASWWPARRRPAAPEVTAAPSRPSVVDQRAVAEPSPVVVVEAEPRRPPAPLAATETEGDTPPAPPDDMPSSHLTDVVKGPRREPGR